MTEYTPNENQARAYYATARNDEEGVPIPDAFKEWSRFLARVRRDAWDEGYDAAVEFYDIDICLAADNPYEETP